jgi:sigma-B regulation protein RsbU (phosphoserine phosphatase)
MAVPLYDDGKMFGVLYADTTNPNHYFTKDYLRITATFGNILAAKMVNYRLLKEKQAKEILESELSLASKIQEQLLPRELPNIDSYDISAFQVQCQQVGGDLYDIIELDDGRILFIIADVSGKGIGAALLASNILASFRILYNTKDFSIMDAICRVSKKLLEFTLTGDYATLFIGTLNPNTNMLHYINAGCHNYPLVIKSNGEVEYFKASGIPIGAIDIINWKEETYEMNAGDLLIAFTDGIPEASNQNGEQFGDERLERFVITNREQPPEQLTNSIMNEVNEFIKDNPRSDDITMMILRREQ